MLFPYSEIIHLLYFFFSSLLFPHFLFTFCFCLLPFLPIPSFFIFFLILVLQPGNLKRSPLLHSFPLPCIQVMCSFRISCLLSPFFFIFLPSSLPFILPPSYTPSLHPPYLPSVLMSFSYLFITSFLHSWIYSKAESALLLVSESKPSTLSPLCKGSSKLLSSSSSDCD